MRRQLLLIFCFVLISSIVFSACKKEEKEAESTPEPTPTVEPESLPTESDTEKDIETIIGGTPVLLLDETTTEGTTKKGELILISLPASTEEGYEWEDETPEGIDKTGSDIGKKATPSPEEETAATPSEDASSAPEGEATPEPNGEQHHFGFKASEAKDFVVKMRFTDGANIKEELEFKITITE